MVTLVVSLEDVICAIIIVVYIVALVLCKICRR